MHPRDDHQLYDRDELGQAVARCSSPNHLVELARREPQLYALAVHLGRQARTLHRGQSPLGRDDPAIGCWTTSSILMGMAVMEKLWQLRHAELWEEALACGSEPAPSSSP